MRRIALLVVAVAVVGASAPAAGGANEPMSRFQGTLPNGRPIPMYTSVLPQHPGVDAPRARAARTEGCSNVFSAPGRPDNVRVVQDCGYLQQAEEWVDVNPADPRNIVVSQNDGSGVDTSYNQTSVSPSLSGGDSWYHNTVPPGLNRVPTSQGDTFAYPRCSDPASAHDRHGNLYYSCTAFTAPYGLESGVLVWKSNHCYKGTYLHSPLDASCSEPALHARPVTVVDNLGEGELRYSWDKELMAVDRYGDSPYDGAVYVTATRFDFACGADQTSYCESPIFFFRSNDGGITWSGTEISGTNSDVCISGDVFDPAQDASRCNFDQGSFPVVERDGSIDVVFENCNTPTLVCQQLFVRSADGGATWSAPVHVADDAALQPINLGDEPDRYGCPPGNPCLAPNGYRMNDFPSMGVDLKTGKLAVFWADFRHGGPCAVDLGTGLPVEPCDNHNNDVFVAVSTDHGATWGRTRAVARAPSAQWQPWGDVGENGTLYVAYYDRRFGNAEKTGKNDITLAISENDGKTWRHRRITTDSMPNLTCRNNPVMCGFLGDYMSLQWFRGDVYVVWGDTRPRTGTTPESDTYFATLHV
ncbi:MAG: sialidase family protein [Actinomycetota bacterium]